MVDAAIDAKCNDDDDDAETNTDVESILLLLLQLPSFVLPDDDDGTKATNLGASQ